jgi:hypothetical protein
MRTGNARRPAARVIQPRGLAGAVSSFFDIAFKQKTVALAMRLAAFRLDHRGRTVVDGRKMGLPRRADWNSRDEV